MNRYLRRRQRRMERDRGFGIESERRYPRRQLSFGGRYDYGMDYDRIALNRGIRTPRRGEDYAMSRGDYDRNYDRGYAMDGHLEGETLPREYYYDGRSASGGDEEYRRDLQDWISKMKSKDRFNMTKEQVMSQAKQMGARIGDECTDEEFYALYLAMATDYSDITSDPTVFIRMAIDFLKDDDVEMRGSDKLCAYLYSIVLGDDN